MDLKHRKLLSDSTEQLCESDCNPSSSTGYCISTCLDFCPDVCLHPYSAKFSRPPGSSPSVNLNNHRRGNRSLVISLVFLAATFLLVFLYCIYFKFYKSSRNRSREPLQHQTNHTHDEFLHEDHGPVVDHHIWHIRTVGLQPSIISSITVLKYKKDDGLVEGTDCSVCLSEFEEDETLRLLPKCSHAFHIPCIDTWLRSHTNCPNCRAPIVTSTTTASSSSSSSSGTDEETRLDMSTDSDESVREVDSRGNDLVIGVQQESELVVENGRERDKDSNEEEESIQPMRRSVSLDNSSALKISQALANVCPEDSNGNSETQLEKSNGLIVGIALKAAGNQSRRRSMASSSSGRILQNGQTSLKRSVSWNGKFLLSRYRT